MQADEGDASLSLPFSPYLFPSASLVIDTCDIGVGTFEVRESEVVWLPDHPSPTSTPCVVPFRAVSLSAIAENADSSPQSLYLQIDVTGLEDGNENGNDICDGNGGGETNDPMDPLREWRVTFRNDEDLRKAFEAMCDGALRNPESDEDVEEMGMGGWFTAESLADGVEGSIALEEES